ncbi:MAG TPA: HEAT repeat domain-containing protein, partial [Gemmataceae bacterium]|nr:HEAT repeat domain-containing protein [Gemmataceae bacterium]
AIASAAGDEDIRKAVERGVESLRARQDNDGSWSFGNSGHAVGTSALVGLAMLECDVPGSDQAVKDAARAVRSGVSSINDTYDISLAVMFLDRLGLADDDPLIESLSQRLLAGQTASGGWGYFCPHVSSEARRLKTGVDKKNSDARDRPEAQKQARRGNLQNDPRNQFAGMLGDDNSNTQFATLALWIARRHHTKVDTALKSVESRFRRSQNADGGWGYKALASGGMMGGMSGSTASMTCAGLLGLAVGYGVSTHTLHTNIKPKKEADKEKETPRDAAVARGINFLAQVLEPALRADDDPPAMRNFGRGGFGMRGGGMGGGIVHNGLGSEYYFLWSLERVAMVYSLKTLGDKDWYAIGSKYLLKNQENDGSWRGNLGPTVDTCFALFFLRRANLAADLTTKLRIKGPAVVDLRAKGAINDGEKDAPPTKMPPEKTDPGKTKSEGPDRLAATRSGASPTPSGNPLPSKKVDPEPPIPSKAAPVKEPESSVAKKESPRAQSPQPDQELVHDQLVAKLRDQLVKASPVDQPALVDKLRDAKGSANTDALAEAIAQLSGDAKSKASEALAQRLARMTADTLRDKLKDENVEVRRAAALACAMKEDRSLIPDLIGLLEDRESRVGRAAYASLKALTDEDFGPSPNADVERRSQSVARWRQWWAKNMSKTSH